MLVPTTYESAREEFYKRREALKGGSLYESDSYDCRREDDYDDDDADCFCG